MFKNTIGCNIRKYREEMEWNQQELAKRIHTSRQSVSAYERGAAQPDIYTLIHIADIFHVTLDDLTGHRPLESPGSRSSTYKTGTNTAKKAGRSTRSAIPDGNTGMQKTC